MSDLMREEFEDAYLAELINRGQHGRFKGFRRSECGDYFSNAQNSAWWAWQASRECLVIELPDCGLEDARDVNPGISNTFDSGYNFATNKIVDVLEGLGLEVAP